VSLQGKAAAMTIDARTIAAVRAGDAAAFEAIVGEYQPRLYRFLFGMVGDAELARDLTQDTFLAAYRALPKTSEDLNLTGWLFQIARNCARSHWRRRKLVTWLPFGRQHDEDSDSMPDEGAYPIAGPEDVVLERQVVGSALRQLQATDRECLLLCADGFSYTEIGDITGLTLPAVKGRIFRARRDLRTILESGG
jgi:RNA polymerase sigma-70 factor (ECF subfamily)